MYPDWWFGTMEFYDFPETVGNVIIFRGQQTNTSAPFIDRCLPSHAGHRAETWRLLWPN